MEAFYGDLHGVRTQPPLNISKMISGHCDSPTPSALRKPLSTAYMTKKSIVG